MIKTVGLLLCSNVFMTVAWYRCLKHRSSSLLTAILVSWLIALPEYCFQVPANRWLYLDERLRLRDIGSFACILGAVVFAFWGNS